MKQLDNSIFLLENSNRNAIKVQYCNTADNYSTIENNATAEILIAKYGSIIQFFESLYAKGIRKLRICDRKNNGSVYMTINQYTVDFTAKDGEIQSEPIIQTTPEIPVVENVYKEPTPAYTPNVGMYGVQGLGMVEIHRIQDYDILVSINQKLEVENAALKAKNEALRDENLRNELLGTKNVEKSESHAQLVAKYSPIVLALIEKFQPVAKVVETAGLVGVENLSPLQNSFLKIIQTADESVLIDLMAVAQGFSNEQFDTELTELMKKFNLIQS